MARLPGSAMGWPRQRLTLPPPTWAWDEFGPAKAHSEPFVAHTNTQERPAEAVNIVVDVRESARYDHGSYTQRKGRICTPSIKHLNSG